MSKFLTIIALTCLFKAVYSIPTANNIMEEGKLKEIIPMENGKAVYTQIVACGNTTTIELFRRSRLWLAKSNHENQILVSDKETGDLVSQGTIAVKMPRSENIVGGIYSFRYTLAIECANLKYRSSIMNIQVHENGHLLPIELFNLKSEQETKDLYILVDKKLTSLLEDLEQHTKEYKSF